MLLLTLRPEHLEHLETAAQRWRALEAPGDEQPITGEPSIIYVIDYSIDCFRLIE